MINITKILIKRLKGGKALKEIKMRKERKI